MTKVAPSTIGSGSAVLRVYRVAQNLSQRALGERAGCTKETVSNIERGVVSTPRRRTALAIAAALGVEDVSVLFPDSDVGDG